MENYFTSIEAAPGIFHIYEPAKVCCTLIVGSTKALLIDSGYGMVNIREYVETLTDLPVTLVNTHCHLDHSGGNHLWGTAYAHPFEKEVYKRYNQPSEKVSLINIRPTPEDLDMDAYLPFKPCKFIDLHDYQIFDLGNRKVEAIFLPGHTKGSVVFFDHLTGTLMSGDEIGNSVWIMFPTMSGSVEVFQEDLKRLQKDYPIKRILYSHLQNPLPPKIIDYVLAALDNRGPQNDTPFIHPRHGYAALKHKEFIKDIKGISCVYLVYPNPATQGK